MMRVAITPMILLAPALAHADGRCDARADCPSAMHCVHNACVVGIESESAKDNEETRGYFGVALGAALPTIWANVGEGAQLAARVGLFTGPIQLQLEVSPGTTIFAGMGPQPMGMFEAAATIGVLPRISDMVYWLLRVGGGAGALFNVQGYSSSTARTSAFGELRLDFSGVVIRPSRHLFIELDVPSFRVLFMPGSNFDYPFRDDVFFTWVTSVTVAYVF